MDTATAPADFAETVTALLALADARYRVAKTTALQGGGYDYGDLCRSGLNELVMAEAVGDIYCAASAAISAVDEVEGKRVLTELITSAIRDQSRSTDPFARAAVDACREAAFRVLDEVRQYLDPAVVLACLAGR